MTLRKLLLSAAIATSALALAACGGRNSNTPDSGTGCTGVCSTPDSGTPDSGTPDSGVPDSGTGSSCKAFVTDHPTVSSVSTALDAGEAITLEQLRYGRLADGGYIPYGAHVIVNSATIQTAETPSSSGAVGFWVVDGSDAGMYVYAYANGGTVGAANVVPGNVVDLDGFFDTQSPFGNVYGRRYSIQDSFINGNSTPLIITLVGTGTTPTALSVDASCAMDARGGLANLYQDSQPNAGRRIHINGPLTLTDPKPIAMASIDQYPDGGVQVNHYNGFEVSGGILVYDGNTFKSDAGCDWSSVAESGKTVTFPNGISGIWDTYTMKPCIVTPLSDGGTTCSRNGDYTYIPNSKSLVQTKDTPNYTFALFPANCNDLPGDAGT